MTATDPPVELVNDVDVAIEGPGDVDRPRVVERPRAVQVRVRTARVDVEGARVGQGVTVEFEVGRGRAGGLHGDGPGAGQVVGQRERAVGGDVDALARFERTALDGQARSSPRRRPRRRRREPGSWGLWSARYSSLRPVRTCPTSSSPEVDCVIEPPRAFTKYKPGSYRVPLSAIDPSFSIGADPESVRSLLPNRR